MEVPASRAGRPFLIFTKKGMEIALPGLAWSILIVFAVNLAAMMLIRTEERFWLPQTASWIILLVLLLLSHVVRKEEVIYREDLYRLQRTPGSNSDREAQTNLENARSKASEEADLLIRLLGLQSLICVFSQAIGFRLTGNRLFRRGLLSFLLFFIIYLGWEFIRLFADTNTGSML